MWLPRNIWKIIPRPLRIGGEGAFKPKQDPVSDPASSGTGLDFIASASSEVSDDEAGGVILRSNEHSICQGSLTILWRING